jgi:putative hydrolase of the HAD superfamily
MKYRHLFFDLDHTLWDFDKNSAEALAELHESYGLSAKGIPDFDLFLDRYRFHNEFYWEKYRNGLVDKATLRVERFHQTLKEFGLGSRSLAKTMEEDYLEISPYKQNLFEGALEILTYLVDRYRMHIITNGFNEVQFIKIRQSGLEPFFEEVITSEQVGVRKPHPQIYKVAMKRAGAKLEESCMIGDNFNADIQGALQVGMDHVYFNPEGESLAEQVQYEIRHLRELKGIF